MHRPLLQPVLGPMSSGLIQLGSQLPYPGTHSGLGARLVDGHYLGVVVRCMDIFIIGVQILRRLRVENRL